MTLVVLTGVALLLRSWVAVQNVDPGYDAAGVHAARIVLPPDRYRPGDGEAHVRFFEGLREAPFLAIFRIEAGQIAELWVEWDNVAMLTQLGLFPPPPASSERDEAEASSDG